jgi:hypothetical protein
LTALLPPPPTPRTLIRAKFSTLDIISCCMFASFFYLSY